MLKSAVQMQLWFILIHKITQGYYPKWRLTLPTKGNTTCNQKTGELSPSQEISARYRGSTTDTKLVEPWYGTNYHVISEIFITNIFKTELKEHLKYQHQISKYKKNHDFYVILCISYIYKNCKIDYLCNTSVNFK